MKDGEGKQKKRERKRKISLFLLTLHIIFDFFDILDSDSFEPSCSDIDVPVFFN